ncbi:type II toxin-antitoxin system death-on-curing family toxin [Shewanella sp. S23-S33]|uniref:type II toxin-antitoxin system death-on-curing family toxin n=1 Tax=Shewanella sp. S23-S33 TaxID=3342769 RepID=UPI00372D708F
MFEIAAKYTACIAVSHACPDANKRTGLAAALEYLSLNDYEITEDNELLANAVRDLVLQEITETSLTLSTLMACKSFDEVILYSGYCAIYLPINIES